MKDTVKEYLDRKKGRASRQKKAVATLLSLSLVVAAGVTWSLHQTGESLTGQTFCGKTEHTHTEACLKKDTADTKTDKVLTCTLPEHTHTDACIQKTLICGMEEGQGAHTHTADCYQAQQVLTCTQTEHVHGDGCYDADGNLICTTPEHTHGDGCYTTEQVLVCGQEESSGHVHTDACYEITYTCGMQEHTHTDACYTAAAENTSSASAETAAGTTADGTAETKTPEYTCGLEEHKHTLQCYSNPNADLESAAVWEKTFAGVTLTGDYGKDVVAIAKTQLGYHESTANYNVVKADDGTEKMKGYTRYGAWYGSPYEDWCAMFASFCIHYADVHFDNGTAYPLDGGCQNWIETLSLMGRYVARDSWTTAIGDLVFFDWNNDGTSDHVGIVEALTKDGSVLADDADPTTADGIKTIEGNSSDQVAERSYSRSDSTIMGYGMLPVKLEEETTTTKTAQFESYTVTVSYDKNANIPEDAELVVTRAEDPTDLTELAKTLTEATGTKIGAEGAEILSAETTSTAEVASDSSMETIAGADLLADAGTVSATSDAAVSEAEKPEKTVSSVDTLDISFMENGEKIEPAEGSTISVQITITGGVDLGENSELGIVHYKEDGTTEVVGGLTQDSDDAQNTVLGFETNSFSPYRIVRLAATQAVTITSIDKVEIVDSIEADGHYSLAVYINGNTSGTPDYTGAEAAAILKAANYTISWSDGTNTYNPGYSVIINNSTVNAVEDNGGWINVAYVKGGGKTFTVTVKDAAGKSIATSVGETVTYSGSLLNGGFEDGNTSWKTTAGNGSGWIEIGDVSRMSNAYLHTSDTNVSGASSSSTKFAELNSDQAGALYQDVLTMPGVAMNWSFSHRARTNSGESNFSTAAIGEKDEMAMIIAPYELTKNITSQDQLVVFYQKLGSPISAGVVQYTSEGTYGVSGKTYSVYVCYDAAEITRGGSGYYELYPKSDWVTRNSATEGTYTVPDGQYVTRFFFMAIATAYDKVNKKNDNTVGNLLDDVWFSQDPLPVADGEARVKVVKKVYGDLSQSEAVTLLGTAGLIKVDDTEVPLTGIEAFTDTDGKTGWQASYTKTDTVATGSSKNFKAEENTSKAGVTNYTLKSTTVQVNSGTVTTGTTADVTVAAKNEATITFANTYEKDPEPDNPYIQVQKTFVGLTEAQVNSLTGFKITVSGSDGTNKDLTLAEGTKSTDNDGNIVYTWKIDQASGTTYTVTESGEKLSNYTEETTGTGDSITTAASTLTFDNEKVETKCNDLVYTCNTTINYLAAMLTKNGGCFIWTQEPLSASARTAMIAHINNSVGNGFKAESGKTYFYSGDMIKKEDGFTFRNGTIKVADKTITFDDTSQWTKLCYGTYSKANNPELVVSNTYTPNPKDVVIQKTKENGTTALTGAEFALYREVTGENNETTREYYGGVSSDSFTWSPEQKNIPKDSSDASRFILSKLPVGTYYLVETTAPDGYHKLADAIKIEVTVNGVIATKGSGSSTSQITVTETSGVYTVPVTNTTGYELPSTGGPGTVMFTLSGLCLMAGALVYGCRLRRRRERRIR